MSLRQSMARGGPFAVGVGVDRDQLVHQLHGNRTDAASCLFSLTASTVSIFCVRPTSCMHHLRPSTRSRSA